MRWHISECTHTTQQTSRGKEEVQRDDTSAENRRKVRKQREVHTKAALLDAPDPSKLLKMNPEEQVEVVAEKNAYNERKAVAE